MEPRARASLRAQIPEPQGTLRLAQAKTRDQTISANAAKPQEACTISDTVLATIDRLYARWAEIEAKLKD